MNTEFKASAYVVAVVAAISTFFYYLRPYLLQSPPNPFVLACIGATVAVFLYLLIAGPIFLSQLGRSARARAMKFLRTAFWFNMLMATVGVLLTAVPALTPATFVCFAMACSMLRIWAKYPNKKKLQAA